VDSLVQLDLVTIGSRVWLADAVAMELAEKAKCTMWKMN
jgi:hypothetical protein